MRAKIEPQIKQQAKEQSVPREVLFELSSLQAESQTEVWEKIKKNPTIAAIEKSKVSLTKKKPAKKKNQRPDAELVFQALKKALKKDNDAIFNFIPAKKVQKLLEEYGEN